MKSKEFKIVLVINTAVMAILFATWWMNGRDDTWLYATAAIISLSSLSYVPLSKKNEDQ